MYILATIKVYLSVLNKNLITFARSYNSKGGAQHWDFDTIFYTLHGVFNYGTTVSWGYFALVMFSIGLIVLVIFALFAGNNPTVTRKERSSK